MSRPIRMRKMGASAAALAAFILDLRRLHWFRMTCKSSTISSYLASPLTQAGSFSSIEEMNSQ